MIITDFRLNNIPNGLDQWTLIEYRFVIYVTIT